MNKLIKENDRLSELLKLLATTKDEPQRNYKSRQEYYDDKRKQVIKQDTTYYERKKKIYPKKQIFNKIWEYITNKNLAEIIEWAVMEGYYTLPRAPWSSEPKELDKQRWVEYIEKILREMSLLSRYDLVKKNTKNNGGYAEALKIMTAIKRRELDKKYYPSIYRKSAPFKKQLEQIEKGYS